MVETGREQETHSPIGVSQGSYHRAACILEQHCLQYRPLQPWEGNNPGGLLGNLQFSGNPRGPFLPRNQCYAFMRVGGDKSWSQ